MEYTTYLKSVIQKALEDSLNNTNALKPYRKVFLEPNCLICLSTFEDEAVVLPCGHMMHEDCIKKWNEQRKMDPKCPKCNRSFLAKCGN